MISDYLLTGAENAQCGRDLCSMLRINSRELRHAIEQERRAGKPICSSSNTQHPGYFLAANKSEMQTFCRSLFHRAGEIHKTRKACIKAIDSLPDGNAAAQPLKNDSNQRGTENVKTGAF